MDQIITAKKNTTIKNQTRSGNLKEIGMEDIMIEILLRLPVKPVARFKCISKKWNSFISNDASFHARYCKGNVVVGGGSESLALMLGIFCESYSKTSFFPPDQENNMLIKKVMETLDQSIITSVLESHRPHSERLYVVHASNGFLLCSLGRQLPYSYNYIIYNPITKKRLNLPGLHKQAPPHSCVMAGFICQGGYFNQPLQYKVVRAICSRYSPRRNDCDSLTIQSLSSDDCQLLPPWKELKLACPASFTPLSQHSIGAVISEAGFFYLPVGIGRPFTYGVFVFNLNQKQRSSHLEMIALPREAGVSFSIPSSVAFGQTNGFTVYTVTYYSHLEMWALDEQEMKWSMKYKVNTTAIQLQVENTVYIEAINPLNLNMLLLRLNRDEGSENIRAWYKLESEGGMMLEAVATNLMIGGYRRIIPYICLLNIFIFE